MRDPSTPAAFAAWSASISRLPLAGLVASLGLAGLAWFLGQMAPAVGAPVIAIGLGVTAINATGGPALAARLRVRAISGMALRVGIILLGATLDLRDVANVGGSSVLLLLTTLAAGLGFALVAGRLLGIDWRMRLLIGCGTTICGASAIAAVAPVLRAKTEEIAYAISVIFLFNMVAVFAIPVAGRLMGMSDAGFGLWAGTAVNDTSAVVAAGFAYSQSAGAFATIVKLTRTTFIVPMVLGLSLLMPLIERTVVGAGTSVRERLRRAVPSFIGLFLLSSLANTLGLIGPYANQVQTLARFVMVVALAAVGLLGHWKAFAGAGPRPLVLGLGTWAVVAITALVVQGWTGNL